MQFLLCAVYVVFTISGVTFMKLGSMAENLKGFIVPIVNLRITGLSLVGYMCYGISFLLYTVIISKFELGYISPILSGVVQIVTLVVAFFVFKEQFSLNAGIGAAMIIAGVIIMNWKF